MPQPVINIAKICFVANYGKVRKLRFFKKQCFVATTCLGGFMGHRKTSIKDSRISPQATTLVVIVYGLYVLLLLPCLMLNT